VPAATTAANTDANSRLTGPRALDLRKLGFDVTGVDISEDMLGVERTTDPSGDYRLVPGDDLNQFAASSFDLVLCAFPFDNVRGEMKTRIFRDLARLLAPSGIIVNLVSSREIYTHEWASFTTEDFPENGVARSGDVVRIITTDHQDRRPVEDILWTDESYRAVYREAGLEAAHLFQRLAKGDEPYSWVSETKIAPWVWSIRADVVRKLDRGETEPEVHASGSAASDEAASGSEDAPF